MIIRKEAIINKSYREQLFEEIRSDGEFAIGYINSALEGEEYRILLLSLYDVIDAFGGLEYFSRESGIPLEKLDRIIDEVEPLEDEVLEALARVLGWEIATKVPHIVLRSIKDSSDLIPHAL